MSDAQVSALRHSSREMVRELGFTRPTFGDSGLTHTRCHALVEIGRSGSIGVLELAARLRLDKASASRIVKELVASRLVRVDSDGMDGRRRVLSLTRAGTAALAKVDHEADDRVERALALLSQDQKRVVLEGITLYAHALERARQRERFTLRPIRRRDDAAIDRILRAVMTEFGATASGYAIHDAEVGAMSRSYARPGAAYFVVTDGANLVGGGGFAPLEGGERGVCELRKMYFVPEIRGLGLGRELLELCLREARSAGYQTCYLETLERMTDARRLYEKSGFEPIAKPMGNTGHFGCDAWYARKL